MTEVYTNAHLYETLQLKIEQMPVRPTDQYNKRLAEILLTTEQAKQLSSLQVAYVVSIKYLYLYSDIFDALLQCRFDSLFSLLGDYSKLKRDHSREDFAEKLIKELCLMGVLKFFMIISNVLKYQTQLVHLLQPAVAPLCELMKYVPLFFVQNNYFRFIKSFLEYFLYIIPDRLKAHKQDLAQAVQICEQAEAGTYQFSENKGVLSFLSFSSSKPGLSAEGVRCVQAVEEHSLNLQEEDPNALEQEIIKRMSKIMKYRTTVLDQEKLVTSYHVNLLRHSLTYEEFETICSVNRMAIQELVACMQQPTAG